MEATAIRPARPEDAAALLAIYAPYVEKTAVTFEYQPPSLEEFAGRIRRTLYDWSAEASIYVAEAARGSGVGGALYRALEQLLAAQGILNVNACIAVPCGAHDPYLTGHSAEFHAHWGYQLVGRFHQCGYKFGRWYDMIWMEKFLGEHPERPRAVVPFPQVDWAAVL